MTRTKTMKICSLLLALTVLCTLLCACGGEKEAENIPATTDNYRTYYQIFPYSFADSNGDGVGDIQGIISKLDYIDSLHFDGIWLTPVHQSPSYHKYDVVDYKSIDSKFGTLEDYDKLVEECHKRGMTILLDLVINHSSVEHDWFEASYIAHTRGAVGNRYYNYYNWSNTEVKPNVWHKNGSLYYEGQFWSGMPDLNLQYVLDEPDGYLAQDLTEIMRYWLIDHNVDGFRLDAVTSYFTDNTDKNTEFLTWINDTAKSIKPNCYIVGEGSWGSTKENTKYQSSGIDSFFAFEHGYAGDHSISRATRLGYGSDWSDIDKATEKSVAGGIPALFISNHDTARAWGILQGAVDVNYLKMGYGLMAMCCGSTFLYYGDEVGMTVYKRPSDKDFIDEMKRQPMPWGDEFTCKPVKGSLTATDSDLYPLGTVKDNLKDKDSVVNYIARANALRRAFPQIARTYGKEVYWDGGSVSIVQKGSGDDIIYIAVNVSSDFTETVDLMTELNGSFILAGTLSAEKMPSMKNGILTLPAQSIAVFKTAK